MPIPEGSPSRGKPIPEKCPSQEDHHASRTPANHRAAPHLCHSLSLAAVRPHAWMWGCLWGQWPSLSPLAPAPVTSVPSPALLFPRSRGEPSAPAGSGDGRCSFPVCRLVPPGAAPNARPRRHQPHRPGKFQHRRCCSQGAMVMGRDVPAGSGGRNGWDGDGHSGRKKGVCGEGVAESGGKEEEDGQTAARGADGCGMGR